MKCDRISLSSRNGIQKYVYHESMIVFKWGYWISLLKLFKFHLADVLHIFCGVFHCYLDRLLYIKYKYGIEINYGLFIVFLFHIYIMSDIHIESRYLLPVRSLITNHSIPYQIIPNNRIY